MDSAPVERWLRNTKRQQQHGKVTDWGQVPAEMRVFLAIACLAWAGVSETLAAPFQNLDFESATLPVIPYGQLGGLVPVSDGLPGWTAFVGTNLVTEVLHNNITVGGPMISVWGPDWPYGTGARIEGDFTVVLAGGSSATLAISQTGIVPLGNHWLLFNGREGPTAGDVFGVSLNSQNVPITALATYADYTLYGGDISAFAGSQAELRFTTFQGFANTLTLDSIVFSPVPEPGAGTLLVCGLLLTSCAWRRRFRDKPCRK